MSFLWFLISQYGAGTIRFTTFNIMRHKRIGRSSGYVSQTDHLDQKAKKLRCPIAMRQIRLPRMLIIGNLRLIALACSAMRRIRPRVMTHVAGPITALAVFCAAAPAASAQQAPDLAAPPPLVSPSPPNSFLSGLQVIAYPYFWMAGLNMAITTPLARAPKVNISAGPGEIISDLNNVPFMGAAELRDGPLGFLPDAMHIPLGSRSPRETSFFGGNTGVALSFVTGDFLYRVLDQPPQTMDGGLGFRFWDVSTDTILNGRGFIPTVIICI